MSDDCWMPIEICPTEGRQKITLRTPFNQEGAPAYADTWWTAGHSVECKPTHWKLGWPEWAETTETA
jgi:hypothetical protein